MTRRRAFVLAAVTAAALALGGAVALARDGRQATPRGALSAAPSASPVPVVVPGHPGDPATVTDSNRVTAPANSPYNAVDVEFARMMIPHHAQALQMTELVPARAADARVKSLAERMRLAQAPEMTRLRSWLAARRLAEKMDGHHHATMPGMQSAEALRALSAARGTQFDRLFVNMMTAHHRGAVEMAGTVLARGDDQMIEEMANEMAVEQSAEIERMRQLGIT